MHKIKTRFSIHFNLSHDRFEVVKMYLALFCVVANMQHLLKKCAIRSKSQLNLKQKFTNPEVLIVYFIFTKLGGDSLEVCVRNEAFFLHIEHLERATYFRVLLIVGHFVLEHLQALQLAK